MVCEVNGLYQRVQVGLSCARELTPLNIFVKERYNSVLDEKSPDRLKTLGTAWKVYSLAVIE